MSKYRKKPIVIDATQWHDGDDLLPGMVMKRCSENMKDISVSPCIPTLEGDVRVSDGDWIITGVVGERYPCKPDIFEKTYEMVEE